jgi:hypothetical protein
MRGGRPVIEDVAQVRIALPAPYLNAPHAKRIVRFGLDIFIRDGRPKARPARA